MDSGYETNSNGACLEKGRELAQSHSLGKGPPVELDCYTRISDVPDWLETVRIYCQKPRTEHNRAADWFLDNNYQVTRAVRQLLEDLPVSFYRKLKPVDDPDAPGTPRVFALANALFDDLQPKISMAGLVDYLNGYQKVSVLSYAELWALPSMLRLVCIERLVDGFHRLNTDLEPPFAVS